MPRPRLRLHEVAAAVVDLPVRPVMIAAGNPIARIKGMATEGINVPLRANLVPTSRKENVLDPINLVRTNLVQTSPDRNVPARIVRRKGVRIVANKIRVTARSVVSAPASRVVASRAKAQKPPVKTKINGRAGPEDAGADQGSNCPSRAVPQGQGVMV